MCILTIRSWPCGHSRCTSSDICMDALSIPGRAPYDCPFASHAFCRENSLSGHDWPCPVCSRRNSNNKLLSPSPVREETRDLGHQPASFSPQTLQQQALNLQRARTAAQRAQSQRAEGLRKASRQLEIDRAQIGLPPSPFTDPSSAAEQTQQRRPRSGHSYSSADDEDSLTRSVSSGSSGTASEPASPKTPTFGQMQMQRQLEMWNDFENCFARSKKSEYVDMRDGWS